MCCWLNRALVPQLAARRRPAHQVLYQNTGERGIVHSLIPSSLLSPVPPPEAAVYVRASSLCFTSNHNEHKVKEAKMTESVLGCAPSRGDALVACPPAAV